MSIRQTAKKLPLAMLSFRLSSQILRALKGRDQRRRTNASVLLAARLMPDGNNRFCGYYDHSPFNSSDERFLLTHSVRQSSWRLPSPSNAASIEIFDWRSKKIEAKLGRTYSWNWQQGARALWLDSRRVIFNVYDIKLDCYRADIVCSDSGVVEEIPVPVQEVDVKGRIYGFSYEALASVRPDYGYRNRPVDSRTLTENGVDQFDPQTNRLIRLLSISALVDDAAARHGATPVKFKLNHIMASPDANMIAFLFRYHIGQKRITDLYYFNLISQEVYLLVEDGNVSHACWWDSASLVATMNGPVGFGYYIVPVDTEHELRLICTSQDGHPSKVNNSHILTDTYPDRYGLRHLMLLKVGDGSFSELAVSPEPLLLQGETRCDLHPSLSPSGRWIQFDCAIGHMRSVAVIENPLCAVI